MCTTNMKMNRLPYAFKSPILIFRWAEKIMQRQGSTLWGLIETDSSFNYKIQINQTFQQIWLSSV